MKYNSRHVLQKVESYLKEASLKSKRNLLTVLPNETTCKPGCSHCCSRPLSITLAEAAIIRDFLLHTKKWNEVKKRALSMSEFSSLDEITWFQMNIKCPVLDPATNQCLSYNVRPALCSTHYVVSDPSFCDPWGTTDVSLQIVNNDRVLDEFKEKMKKLLGEKIWFMSMPIYAGILFVDKIIERDGLSLDQILIRIGKGE